tara:strand:- start:9727 stop:10530 length:804 start_codon:yes stop_codon:yes gene_type:complete
MKSMNTEENVNIDNNDDIEFDMTTIPESVRKSIEKEARHGYIPQERYDNSVGKLKDRLTEVESKVTAPAAAPAKTYSRKELQDYVDAGSITEDQRDQQLDFQAQQQAEARMDSKLAAQQEISKADSVIEGYRAVVDDLDDPNSDNRQKAEDAYKDIVDLHGKPKDDLAVRKLNALALQQAFGPLKNLQKRHRDISNKARETHQETGGYGSEGNGGSDPETKGMSKRVVDYYKPQVDKGQMSWAAVKDELKYVKNPAVRERLGLKQLK